MARLPVYSIPHGGGPWPWMKDAFGDPAPYDRLEAWLRDLGRRHRGEVKSLLVVSAHWEESVPTVHFGAAPGMHYDYGGFPDWAFELKWPAPGHPELAARAETLLRAAGLPTARELHRGYDHGTFVPLMLAFPEADLPTAQVSLVNTLDPEAHLRIGRALAPLRDEGVLILASGMSYHNMRGFFQRSPATTAAAARFDAWLNAAVTEKDVEARRRLLAAWRQAPEALHCHPRSEHLVPLFVAAGAAGEDAGAVDFTTELMGVAVSAHRFG